MRWGRATSLGAGALAFAVLLVGCGDSGESGSGPAASAPPAVTAERAPAVSPLRTNRLGRRELSKVRDLLDRLVAGVSVGDPSICTEVYSRSYAERLMERRGEAAVAACRKEAAESRVRVQVVQLERVNVERTNGTLTGRVRLVQDVGGGLVRLRMRIVRQGSGYRITRIDAEQLTTPPKPPKGALELKD